MADDLDTLQRKIDEAKPPAGNKNTGSGNNAELGQALRFSVELLSGIAAGGGLGYFLDRWLHTFPWLFIIGFFIGAVAGFRNLLREANRNENGK
jgi:ATP synthase protein I